MDQLTQLQTLLTQADALAAELNSDPWQSRSSFTAPLRARVHAALELVPHQIAWFAKNPQPTPAPTQKT